MTHSNTFASSLFTEFQKGGSSLSSDDGTAASPGRKERPSASRKLETRRAIEDYIELKRLHNNTEDYAFDLDE